MDAAPVADRDNAAGPAPGHDLVGLDRHHQPAASIVMDIDHVQAGGVEHLISAGAPGRTEAASTIRHVGVCRERTAWSLPILEASTLPACDHDADTTADLNHAQIRRAGMRLQTELRLASLDLSADAVHRAASVASVA